MVRKTESMPYRWLITGGCGFIGTSLISHLLRKNTHIQIRVLDNLSVGAKEDLSDVCEFTKLDTLDSTQNSSQSQTVELIVGDIRDFEICLECCEQIDVIIHLAASTGVLQAVQDPRADMESNAIGTFNLLEAARVKGVRKFIFASSGAPLGDADPPIHEEKAPKPVSPYGASKLAGEGYCSAYYRTFGLETIALRFGNVYGTRSKHKESVIAKFLKQAFSGEPLEIYGDGNQTRDFIYIDDLIHAIILSVRSEFCGEVFQIATYRETSINELAQSIKLLVESETGKKVHINHGKTRPGDLRRSYSNISKAKTMLGFEPQYDLDRGLKATFHYFFKNYKNKSVKVRPQHPLP